jgi:hypothetical protein
MPWHKPLLVAAVALTGWTLGAAREANATPITYTFGGTGSGDILPLCGGFIKCLFIPFVNQAFTFTFVANTSTILPAPPSFFQFGIGGTFSVGAFTDSLNADNIVTVNNNASTPRVGFFNSAASDGGAIQDSAFLTYSLATSLGPITGTGASLLPDLGGGAFDFVDGAAVELTDITSLTFTATVASVPEPGTIALFGASLLGLGWFARRQRRA